MQKTIGNLLDELQRLKTKEEARAYLMKLLHEGDTDAWSNIRYITGYLGEQERRRILNLFNGG